MNTAVSAKNVNCVDTFENHEVKILIYLTFGSEIIKYLLCLTTKFGLLDSCSKVWLALFLQHVKMTKLCIGKEIYWLVCTVLCTSMFLFKVIG
jgi:hypothetical protein